MRVPAIERDPTFEATTQSVVPRRLALEKASQLRPDFSQHAKSYIKVRTLVAGRIQTRPMPRLLSCCRWIRLYSMVQIDPD
jgi:hypothetical protein